MISYVAYLHPANLVFKLCSRSLSQLIVVDHLQVLPDENTSQKCNGLLAFPNLQSGPLSHEHFEFRDGLTNEFVCEAFREPIT